MMQKKIRVVKLKEYGDDWVNRLAQVEDAFSKMSDIEKVAALQWLHSKYDA